MTTTTLTLTDFLLARITEDEAVARAAICQCGGKACTVEVGWYHADEAQARLDHVGAAVFVIRNSPARVLAECEAKRRIVEAHPIHEHARDEPYCGVCVDDNEDNTINFLWWPCPTLRALALPYADHPDYSPDWRP